MKVLFATSEAVPFAKTGGLADVSSSLSDALKKAGIDVRLILPKYRGVKKLGQAQFFQKTGPGPVFIENDKFFDRPELYGDAKGDYPDNLERFTYFCQQIFETCKRENFKPDIIHCNDWQTALVCVYLKTTLSDDPFFKGTKTVLSIHNLAFQGHFGDVNLLRDGIINADAITTVSPTYSKEIQTAEFGCGLDDVLRSRKDALFGIINGIDEGKWPVPADKAKAKAELQKEAGLPQDGNAAVLGSVGRLAEQKGIDILIEALEELSGRNVQVIVLGKGDASYEKMLKEAGAKHSKILYANIGFDNEFAKRIYAGSDMFLMPSRYEPCGLGQMISFRYGTVPVARKTGGLIDTIKEYNGSDGNGFLFEELSAAALVGAVDEALEVFKDKGAWSKLIERCKSEDFSWTRSAKEYIKLYERL